MDLVAVALLARIKVFCTLWRKKLTKTSSTINLPVSSKARKPPVKKLEMMDSAHPGNNASRSYMVIPMSHDSPIHSFKKAPVYVSTFGWFLNMQEWSGFQLGESKTPVEKKMAITSWMRIRKLGSGLSLSSYFTPAVCGIYPSYTWVY